MSERESALPRSIEVATDEDGVTTLLMNRPDKLNSWDSEMEDQLREAMAHIEADLTPHRVLVIRGAGRAFCAGVDLEQVRAEQQELSARELRVTMQIRHRIFDWFEQIEIPVIAAIHGYCLGGGLELALACDFRLVASDSTLSLPEVSFGQIPGSGAISRLTALAGPGLATDMVMTSRRLNADEALQTGVASRTYPSEEFDAAVAAFARDLAQRPPLALAVTKQLVAAVTPVDLGEARSLERLGQSVLLATEDLREGLAAAAERRSARFAGR